MKPMSPENCKTRSRSKVKNQKANLKNVKKLFALTHHSYLVQIWHCKACKNFLWRLLYLELTSICDGLSITSKVWVLTNLRRQMFSLRAPTHPANPKMKVTVPTTSTPQTGSKPCRRVTCVKSDKTPCGQIKEQTIYTGCFSLSH